MLRRSMGLSFTSLLSTWFLVILLSAPGAKAGATLDLSDESSTQGVSGAVIDIHDNFDTKDQQNYNFLSFSWKKFIQDELKDHPEISFFGLYIGGPKSYEQDSLTVRFRPASTQKIFTTATYLENIGWNTKIPQMLKLSDNIIAESLVPKIGEGSRADGLAAIQAFSNQTISDAMAEDGLRFEDFNQNPVDVQDEYKGKEYKINPYQVSCYSGSGIDGAVSGPNGLAKKTAAQQEKRSTITVGALRYFLEGLKKKPYFEKILRSLPYAGLDGTLTRAKETRAGGSTMANGPARATIAAKTGTLTGVKNLAGYIHVVTEEGADDYIPFVILTRTTSTKDAFELDDTVVNKIAERLHASKIPLEPFTYPGAPKFKDYLPTEESTLPPPAQPPGGTFSLE